MSWNHGIFYYLFYDEPKKYDTIFARAAGDLMSDTIAAIATPLADGAISIIRISGDDAIQIANSLFDKDLHKRCANTITYGFIINPANGERMDEVLVSLFHKPHSFSGEDVIEINCHGGRYITKEILKLVLGQGARLANPGEFTQRAFLNGRIDLTQAESVMDMIEAGDRLSAQMALNGIRGSVKKLLDPLISEILDIIAHIEVNIDYPEYTDIEQLTNDVLLPSISQWLTHIDEILIRSNSGKIIKEGVKTAIVGKPNVGKSSLLNALLEEEKAIVTDIEGTTRDIVEGSIHLQGITLHLIDTAGLRESNDKIEQIGIAKTKKLIEEAELILLVLDANRPLDETDQALIESTKDKERLIVYNKSDMIEQPKSDQIYISAKHNQIEPLLKALNEYYEQHTAILHEPILNNERQIGLLNTAKNHMENAYHALLNECEIDLVTLDIQSAYQSLKEILGEYHRDDLLDTLFANFCLGK